MMKKSRREARRMIRWAKKTARDKCIYEAKSMRLFRRFGVLEGFEYYGYYGLDCEFYGDDHITVTDPMGEVHTYYVASDKETYLSLRDSLELELAIRYKHKNDER